MSSESGPTGTLWRALQGGAPIVVILYKDLQDRQSRVELVRQLIEEGDRLTIAESVDEALRSPQVPVLLLPSDEAQAVDDLAARRDSFSLRSLPCVVLLQRGGSGDDALSRHPFLMSWLEGQILDLGSLELITDTEDAFRADTGMSPDQWLRAWRAGEID